MNHITKKDILFVVIAMVLSTLLAFAFEQFNLRRENIMLIYVATVMLVMFETKKSSLGIITAFTMVFVFNFFFTEPKYTFMIDDANYIITLIIFLVVTSMIGTLSTSLQREIKTSAANAGRMELLYRMSKALLFARTQEHIITINHSHLQSVLNIPMLFHFDDGSPDIGDLFVDPDGYANEISYAISYRLICGKDEPKFPHLSFVIYPITSNKGIAGVLLVDCQERILNRPEKEFIQTGIMHMLTALEREKVSDEQELTRLEVERERIKSTLLRSVSHDLRTPLTTLQSGTSLICDSYDSLDEDTRKAMLQDINSETARLSVFVDNLLNMTRLSADSFQINRGRELADDILTDLYRRVKNRLGNHTLTLQNHNDLAYVEADTQLLMQVLTNLVDNAVRHTDHNARICVSFTDTKHASLFEVSDNGGGIDPKKVNSVFVDYVSIDTHRGDTSRGFGLGLSICKTIVEAHGGKISVNNNPDGGATFAFSIPKRKDQTDETDNPDH